MTKQEIASLAFKLAGIYVIVRSVGHLSAFVVFILGLMMEAWREGLANLSGDWLLVGGVGPLLTGGGLAVVGVLLFRKSDRFTERIFPEAGSAMDQPPGDAARMLGIHAFAYSIVGLAVLARGLPQGIEFVVLVAMNVHRGGWTAWGQTPWLYSIQPLTQLVLGLGLFLGSHGLARCWATLRTGALREKLGLCRRCGYDLTGNVSGVCPECGADVRAQLPPAP